MKKENYAKLLALSAENPQKNTVDIAEIKNITECLKELEKSYYAGETLPCDEYGNEAAFLLLPLLASDIWEIRAKALITIGRTGSGKIAPSLVKWLKTVDEPWWQLQGLDAWWQLPLDIRVKENVIADLIKWAYQPVTVRAMVWLLKSLATEKSAWMFAEFAVSKKSMVVKDEIMENAWYCLEDSLIEQGRQKTVKEIIENVKGFKVWLNFRYREEEKSCFGLYPSPDYLWQIAAEYGVERKSFKNLYHKPRKKDNADNRKKSEFIFQQKQINQD